MPGNEQKHTFIPKAPVTGASAARAAQHAPLGLFFGITLVIFLLTVFAAAGSYAYRAYLTKEVATLNASLEREKAAFEPDTIRAYKRFSGRINTADVLRATHRSSIFSRFFRHNITELPDFLNFHTHSTVRM
jgi:hypothetical protein